MTKKPKKQKTKKVNDYFNVSVEHSTSDANKYTYSTTANGRKPGANNEYTGGPDGPGIGFCGPGGGLVVISVVASHYVY